MSLLFCARLKVLLWGFGGAIAIHPWDCGSDFESVFISVIHQGRPTVFRASVRVRLPYRPVCRWQLTNFRKFWPKRGLKTTFSSANGGGGGEFVGNLKVLSEILEALPPPPTGKSEFQPLAPVHDRCGVWTQPCNKSVHGCCKSRVLKAQCHLLSNVS